MMEPITDPRDISRIAYGFLASKALFAALDLDVFSRLAAGPKTVAQLAGETGVDPTRLEKLLIACATVGLLAMDGEALGNAPASQRHLVRDAPGYFGDYYRFQIDRQLYPLLEHLGAGLRGEVEDWYARTMPEPVEAEYFTRGQHAGSKGPARLLARSVDLASQRALLDVAGGSGAFSIALCRQFPGLSATVLDFPHVVATARRFVAEEGLESRIALVAGDALADAWPGGADTVLISYLLSAIDRRAIPLVLRKAWEVLPPGGLLIVHDFMLGADRGGPMIAALFLLQGVLLNVESGILTAGGLTREAERAGFADGSVRELIPEITSCLLCRKPG